MGKKRESRFDRRKLAKNGEPGVEILHARARMRGEEGRGTGINRETSSDTASARVSSVLDKSRPVGVSGRLTEKFVVAREDTFL